LIAYEKLSELSGYETFDAFQTAHRKWVDEALISCENKRESRWAESIAIGSNKFVNKILSQLGSRAKGRRILEVGQAFQIREKIEPYNSLFDGEKCDIAPGNAYNWRQYT
jgi:putative transposase